jgi:hypothetical protein
MDDIEDKSIDRLIEENIDSGDLDVLLTYLEQEE